MGGTKKFLRKSEKFSGGDAYPGVDFYGGDFKFNGGDAENVSKIANFWTIPSIIDFGKNWVKCWEIGDIF